ncbi:MAG: DUF255 domain-containing protein [Bradyrhizobium sp.]|uniref:thioredoxin domain-containing protein n=1 Tax=Bradyrhizobium sp. TaxID=376 RepID=UPI002388A085|nr:thioredoxin domain-containing protein [Bradyrhizobium sp.]MDE2069227.1 DUF255 domain-containing protein [Bradyrhizobium sp.]
MLFRPGGKPTARSPFERTWRGLVCLAAAFGLVTSLPASTFAAGDEAGWGLPTDTANAQYPYTNRLINSHDPYLLLHAHNPVDWYPWGPEALAKAKQENKPIFVSIGYSTCYWCHVAERLVYSNPDIAKLMNQWFVNIKVDREQRPDVDRVYMLATEILTGHGAWPNNVFLTPDLKPFFAGSYFPPKDDPRIGTGFPTVLAAIHNAWVEHRTDKVLPVAEQVFRAMQHVKAQMAAGAEVPIKPDAWLAKARDSSLAEFDARYGGMGDSRGPKFPRAPSLELLLADGRAYHDSAALSALTETLDAMAFGGIDDQLAGGFHRYSTEPTWSIPHFEKMLYDNAQLLRLYAEAYETTGKPIYRSVALDIGQYFKRDMMAPEGGFYTAQDSQVNGVEGAAYVWTRNEIVATLGDEAAKRFFAVYSLTPVPSPGVPTGGRETQGGVLRVQLPITDTLKRAGFRDATAMLKALAPERAKLLAARLKRPQPARDEKIVTGLNGLTIAALAKSSQILQQPEFLTWARMAGERIWALAYDPKTGALQHEIFQGHAQTVGYLQDYAMLGDGFMALFDATKETVWRDRAAALASSLLDRFAHADGALATTPDEKSLLIPVEDGEDSDVPSGTSIAIDLLLRLSAATADSRYSAAVARVVHHLSGQINDHPEIWPATVVTLNLHPMEYSEIAAASNATVPASSAQQQAFHIPETADHVRASAVVKIGSTDDEIVVTLKVDDGYHINANPASFDYLIPTSVAFDCTKPSRVEYPTPIRFKSAFAPSGLDVYEGSVSIVAGFPRESFKAGDSTAATITAQACDAQTCLPPSEIRVSVHFPVE